MDLREFEVYYEQRIKAKKDDYKMLEWYIARVCSVIANVNRDPKRQKKAFTEKDFIGKVKGEQGQTAEQQEILLKALTLAMGGDISG